MATFTEFHGNPRLAETSQDKYSAVELVQKPHEALVYVGENLHWIPMHEDPARILNPDRYDELPKVVWQKLYSGQDKNVKKWISYKGSAKVPWKLVLKPISVETYLERQEWKLQREGCLNIPETLKTLEQSVRVFVKPPKELPTETMVVDRSQEDLKHEVRSWLINLRDAYMAWFGKDEGKLKAAEWTEHMDLEEIKDEAERYQSLVAQRDS